VTKAKPIRWSPEKNPGGHPNSSTRGHPKLLHPEQM
jgi:hypothetical protein